MSRIISLDFDLFDNFIKEYSMTNQFSNEKPKTELKKAHRNYLSLLFLWSEITYLYKENKLDKLKNENPNSEQSLYYIEESISDIGNGLLCCIHGVYKPAFMALRSSIENLVKAVAFFHYGEDSNVTVISSIFEMTKKTPPFIGERSKTYSRLKQTYSELCAYTHSASLAHMSKVHALSTFPHFDHEKFSEWNSQLKKICKDFHEIIIFWEKKTYHKAHF